MGRRLPAVRFVILLILLVAVATLALWPKTYTVGEGVSQTEVFWQEGEAFVFLSTYTLGRGTNAILEKLESSVPYLSLLFGEVGFSDHSGRAFHLTSSKIELVSLPEGHAGWGTWTLRDGKLQMTAPSGPDQHAPGFRWDGKAFVPVPPEPPPAPVSPGPTELVVDDLLERNAEPEDDDLPRIPRPEREAFRRAGWHYKTLAPYRAPGQDAVLPITLGRSSFGLTLRSSPVRTDLASPPDVLAIGVQRLEITGDGLDPKTQVLWEQTGWRQVSKGEYQARAQAAGGAVRLPTSARFLPWAIVAVLLLQVAKPLWLLFALATSKGRIVKNMASAYSFPPATPAQFPLLDEAALSRNTGALESLGFERLLDFSLLADVPSPASFCRLFVHRRHHCFAEASQIFPVGGRPMPAGCSIQSHLQDGWSIGATDQKPPAFSSLLRRPRALGVCLPGVEPARLLESLLTLRGAVCTDLALSPLGDDTLESYMGHTQRSLQEMREAVGKRSLVLGLSRVALRKFSLLLKARPEYVWLGDYPKEADRRKQPIHPS